MGIITEKYIPELEKYIQEAVKSGDKYDFIDPAYDITDELEELENPIEAVKPIFEMIERSPDIDYGGPGPLGSFLEKFSGKGYEELLLESLHRKPVPFTIHLLHCMINDEKDPMRDSYLELMKAIAENTSMPENVRNEAKDSLSYF